MRKGIIIGIIAAGIIILLFILLRSSQKNEKYDWNSYYNKNEKNPYDLFLLNRLLKNFFPDHKLHEGKKELTLALSAEEIKESSIFFFIDSYFYLNHEDLDTLVAFIERGNQALIISDELSGLASRISETCGYGDFYFDEGIFNPTVTPNLLLIPDTSEFSRSLSYTFMDREGPASINWSYFSEDDLGCLGWPIQKLGQIATDHTNFFVIRIGTGRLFLHSNPLFFTNYHLRDERKLEYAEQVFSHLTPADILWLQPDYKMQFPQQPYTGSESPLQFIISRPALAWALYILVFALILFMLFRSKRRQKVIPLEEPPANTSLEFINTISRLYYQQKNHHKLALQTMKIFTTHIRQRYKLELGAGKNTLELLARKSGYPEKNIRVILDQYTYIENRPEIPLELFLEFHQGIENFYQKSK